MTFLNSVNKPSLVWRRWSSATSQSKPSCSILADEDIYQRQLREHTN